MLSPYDERIFLEFLLGRVNLDCKGRADVILSLFLAFVKLFVHLGSGMERFTAKLRVSNYFECFESRIFTAELNVLMYMPLTATALE